MSTVDIGYFRYQQQYCEFPWLYPELRNIFLLGGYGCVDGDTLLETPSGQVKIRDFQGGILKAYDAKNNVSLWSPALPPVKYPAENLYRVETRTRMIVCTVEHKFMVRYKSAWDTSQWMSLSEILQKRERPYLAVDTENGIVFEWLHTFYWWKKEEYYDLHVPIFNAYIGDGMVNHNCGKTHADRNLLWNLYRKYHSYPIEVLVAGVTITLVRKTLVKAFLQLLNECRIPYKDNSKLNAIQVDKMTFYIIGMDQPENIFAYNGSVFIADELDELPQEVAIDAFAALQERTRIVLPDGRLPFGCLSTTAQGLKGTYRITEDLKEKKRKYCIIRGATRENTTLSPDYLENLESQYDENERAAYLEGKFVNLSSGRVYGHYDESRNRLPFSTEPLQNETVYVGQDFNAGFNKALALLYRNNELITFREFSFKQIGDAPATLRAAFPQNKIVWFPDASGKELLAGYALEIKRYDIDLRFANFNPSIVERIFFVNKLFQHSRMFVTQDCRDLAIALKTRQFDDKGVPEKGRGEKATDHICDCLEYAVYRLMFWLPGFHDILKASPNKETRSRTYLPSSQRKEGEHEIV